MKHIVYEGNNFDNVIAIISDTSYNGIFRGVLLIDSPDPVQFNETEMDILMMKETLIPVVSLCEYLQIDNYSDINMVSVNFPGLDEIFNQLFSIESLVTLHNNVWLWDQYTLDVDGVDRTYEIFPSFEATYELHDVYVKSIFHSSELEKFMSEDGSQAAWMLRLVTSPEADPGDFMKCINTLKSANIMRRGRIVGNPGEFINELIYSKVLLEKKSIFSRMIEQVLSQLSPQLWET